MIQLHQSRASDDQLNLVWRALASPTRRQMLDALREGPRSVGELVMLFPALSRFAVMQHLKALVRSGLVISRKEGRVRTNYLNVVPLHQIYERWVRPYETLWAGALTSLKRRAEGSDEAPAPRSSADPNRSDDPGARVQRSSFSLRQRPNPKDKP